VLAFHGYAASKATLLPVGRALHELGHPVLLVDFYGSGGSSGDGTTLGYLESRDVAAAVAHVRQRWPGRRLVLYGFSMGGAAALRAVAAEGVEADAVIVEATFDTLLNTARNRFHTMGLPATPLAQMLLFWGGLDWGFDAFSLNPADYARAVDCPALVLHGGDDARVPAQQARNLHRAFADARLVEFPGVPHVLIAGARPREWKREVAAFLSGL
jgi:pimeloyl-ACP methyl ester carboxylesterase